MEEFPFHLGALKSLSDDRDWIYENLIYTKNIKSKIPKTLDLRPYLQPVRNQRNQNTCVAQTCACIKEYQERKDINLQQYLSPQFLYNNRSNYPGEGMYARDAMKLLKDIGICLEQTYRYGTIDPKDLIKDYVYEQAETFVIKSYAQVASVEGLKQALFENGPCYISFPVYNYSETFWKPPCEFLGGHAVAVVGYDKDGFILRNSWGTNWGNRGYTNYPYSDFGSHWEIWTAVDPNIPNDDKSCCYII